MGPDEILYILEEVEEAINSYAHEDRGYFLERSEELSDKLRELVEEVKERQRGQ
jgi:predicted transcriptional regulator